ncbi:MULTISPECIES: LysR substrate-binding domain-containing protein [Phyllobacteriaceae]|jgi:LysR family transcriptional regulator, glycine cleavage system transcriptional activator|uniref:Transcriptional regulator n=1 Tax=Mesorhizobium hungaricum TaxID=1566387 RepID=A0A1C2DI75_9HYPH|nr:MULTISPECIES: LysR substrate-binding domain-containing protein [Mesorhizobium]MBN9235409.1 LysR family transcriptional regulator [Mesorhizobium sp.]MDQ0332668.1 LysR family glycine cleavage system transcriptional activator [Mesorhizobium sp. YL-MeA3-2017]OCX14346.1 transcriptional regulator [Mesorhizobium hungaricum]
MKRSRLPLTALRSFEVAGRHTSFSRAAEELHVSQAAISRQIRELETTLSTPLFERLHRKVVLTETGKALLTQLTASFDGIERMLADIAARCQTKTARVSSDASLASCWLIPRLDRFRRANPDIDVVLDVDPRLIEFRAEQAELALRFSFHNTSWANSEAERLAYAYETPVVAPVLLANGAPIEKPGDLRRFTLLHEESREHWKNWFRLAGEEEADVRAPGPMYADMALSKQAALLGHGVALVDLLYMQDELAAGTLIRPFATELNSGGYFLVARNLSKLSEPARIFADWIRAEFAASVAALSSTKGERSVLGAASGHIPSTRLSEPLN